MVDGTASVSLWSFGMRPLGDVFEKLLSPTEPYDVFSVQLYDEVCARIGKYDLTSHSGVTGLIEAAVACPPEQHPEQH